MLNLFLETIRKRMERDNKTEEEILSVLDSFRKKYKDDEIFQPLMHKEEIEEVELTQDERINILQKRYQDHGEETGEWVFPPDEQESEERGKYGRTPLHIAVMEDDIEEIRELIENGADVNMRDNSGMTPFVYALLEGKTEIIKLFEELGVAPGIEKPLPFCKEKGE